MVLPLIPLALIAVGTVTGGGGLTIGGKGAWDIKRAQDQLKHAGDRYQERWKQHETKVGETNDRLKTYGKQQQQALTDVVLRMADFLRRNAKQVGENERLLVDGIDVESSRISGLTSLGFDAGSWVTGALTSAAAAYGAGTGTTALATGFGVASTGAAISGLSGAAAESATLAFLGGGSLATGGGGMALGAAALNFVVVGPALLVGGFMLHGKGSKALTEAAERRTKVAVEIARLDQHDTKLSTVDTRTDELSALLDQLRARGVAALDLLESEPFDAKEHAPRFQRALMQTMAVRDVAAAPVVDAAGDLTERSSNFTVKYRSMGEEDNVA